jgi:hypothetical protein
VIRVLKTDVLFHPFPGAAGKSATTRIHTAGVTLFHGNQFYRWTSRTGMKDVDVGLVDTPASAGFHKLIPVLHLEAMFGMAVTRSILWEDTSLAWNAHEDL